MPYPATRTFWLEPTDQVAIGLRRYAVPAASSGRYGCDEGFHAALQYTGTAPAQFGDRGAARVLEARPRTPRADLRWPATCRCGYRFTPEDAWQDWQDLIYRRTDTDELVTLRNRRSGEIGGPPGAPPGATWDAWWMPPDWIGPDGVALMVRCPNGQDWHVDGQASNCTRKGEPHQCWVRHGDPRLANVTVDKDGDTCAAGAGSIQAGDYHGFLTGGLLTAG